MIAMPKKNADRPLADRLDAYEAGRAEWDRRNPHATKEAREKAYSLIFGDFVLGKKEIMGLCRKCMRVHAMTVVPMESDPSAFRIVCRCGCG
jgi:hypothetical protein